jgi:hypothetical protein
MPSCSRCGDEVTPDQFATAWGNCIPCVRKRQAKALSDYVVATSEEVVQTPYGWTNALCVLGDPVEWLCWHIHGTREEAEECRQELLAARRGRFPVR